MWRDTMTGIARVILCTVSGLMCFETDLAYSLTKNTASSVPRLGFHTQYTHKFLPNNTDLSSPLFDVRPITGEGSGESSGREYKEANVCFITDTEDCSHDKFGNNETPGKPNDPGYGDPDDLCKAAGYNNPVCGDGMQPGDFCPYDESYYKRCVCSSIYGKTCDAEDDLRGVGASCDGKYKECCNICTGYDYLKIPNDYVSNGECDSCDGKKYKIKCDPTKFLINVDCGPQGGMGRACTDDDGIHYENCNCPNKYVWSSVSHKCVCADVYKYSCQGTGYAGGDGESCDEKYMKCKCSEGYRWDTTQGACVCDGEDWCSLNQDCSSLGYKRETCKTQAIKCPFDTAYVHCVKASCALGDILNNDMTCSKTTEAGKTPIGVVVYVGEDGKRQAVALEELPKVSWGVSSKIKTSVLPELTYEEAMNDLDSCGNTQKLIVASQQNGGGVYPAAEAAYNYAPAAAPETKGQWCLPSFNIVNRIDEDIKVQKTISDLGVSLTQYPRYWSSSAAEKSQYAPYYRAWRLSDFGGEGIDVIENVRPVIEF